MYARLVNNIIEYAPSHIKLDGRYIFNPTAEQLAELGYKEVKEDEQPEYEDGYHYNVSYKDMGKYIIKSYSLEADEPDRTETRLQALEQSQEVQDETIDTLLLSQM